MTHEPCEVTGKPCVWLYCCDICNDDYCRDCYQPRDWSLDECPGDGECRVLPEVGHEGPYAARPVARA